MRGYAAALEIVSQQFPQILRGAAILIEGDNQGAISAVNHFKSSILEINQILQSMFSMCAEFKADVIGKWIPRDNLTEADALSREPDSSDWGISSEVFQDACLFFGCKPSLDLFASDVHHTTDRFVSQFYTPGCLAVDALKLDWSELIDLGQTAWIFPPCHCVSSAISLIERYKIDALLCMRVKPGSNEVIQLEQLESATKSTPRLVARSSVSCDPSKRVPNNALNPAFLELGIIHISWPKE